MEISTRPLFSSEDTAATNWLRLLSCFLFPLLLSILIALLYTPIRTRLVAEEHLDLSRQSSDVPSSLLCPPGYVAFLHIINVASGGINHDRLVPIYIGQGVMLGLATVAWYMTACRWMAALPAWLMALAFGCNPLVVTMVGYIHYDILHLGMSVFTGLLLVWTFANNTVTLIVEDILGVRIRELIRTQPRVYLSNIAHKAIFFWSGDSRLLIRAFAALQDRTIYVIQPAWAIGFLIVSSALLHVCGALGLALGLWRRAPTVAILASLFICL